MHNMAKKAKKKKKTSAAEQKQFSAVEANRAAKKRATRDCDQTVSDVLAKVATEANMGNISISHPLISQAATRKLKELGFSIAPDTLADIKCICISW